MAGTDTSTVERDKAKAIERLDRLVANGLCVACRAPHNNGAKRCSACNKRAVETTKRKRHSDRAKGLCGVCRQPWAGETQTCRNCLTATKARREQWKNAGRCVRCGEVSDSNRKSCQSCLAKVRARTQRRRDTFGDFGRCVQCGKANETACKYCETCTYKNGARRWLGSYDRWPELKALFERQKGLCAYTGEPMTLGKDASLDHIIPRRRGGTHSIDNLQWVSWEMNRMKCNWTHQEFLDLLRKVLTHCK